MDKGELPTINGRIIMSQLPDEIYVPLHFKYGTLDYVTAYLYDLAYEENGYKAEDMQEYIPTYRCEERIRDTKGAMIERLRELQSGYERDLDAEPRVYERHIQLCAKLSLIEKLIQELED